VRTLLEYWIQINGSLVYTLNGHQSSVESLVAFPNSYLASGSWDNTVRIWDPNNGSLIFTLFINSSIISLLALSNGYLASGSGYPDNTIKILNPNNGSLLYTIMTGLADLICLDFHS